jgi:hypothetical protein
LKTELSASEALCVRCGFCCDGTLFGHVPVSDEEAARLPAPLEIVEREGKRTRLAFVQPCAGFHAQCILYDSRPETCRSYRCALLKDAEAGAVAYDDAQRIVANLHARRDAIARLVDMPFDTAKRELAANAALNVDAFLMLLSVEADLDRHFRRASGDPGDAGDGDHAAAPARDA